MKHMPLFFSLLVLGFVLSSVSSVPAFAQGTRPVGALAIEWNTRDRAGESATGELAWDFGLVSKTATEAKTAVLRIYNPSDVVLTNLVGTLLNPNFSFKNGKFPGEGGSCGYALPAHSGCRIVLSFKAAGSGLKRGLVRINYWEGDYNDHRPRTSYRPLMGVVTETQEAP